MSKYVKKGYMEMRKWIYLDSNVKYCDLKDFLKAQFVIFRCQNMYKKGTWKWENEFTLRPLGEFTGCSRSLYFTLLSTYHILKFIVYTNICLTKLLNSIFFPSWQSNLTTIIMFQSFSNFFKDKSSFVLNLIFIYFFS